MPLDNFQSNSDLIQFSDTSENIVATNVKGALTESAVKIADTAKGYNLKSGLKAYKAALADVGRNPVHVAIQGTSITFGAYASDLLLTSYVGRIRTALQTKYGNVGQSNYSIPSAVSAEARALTPWWVWDGTWTYGQAGGIGGKSYYAGNSVSTATLTFTGTDIGILFTKASNGSAAGVTVTIDGASQTPPDFSGTSSAGNIKWYTGLSAAEHTMVITCDPTNKYCYIEDAVVYSPTVSGDKGVYVYRFGAPSAMTVRYVLSSANIVASLDPHLVIIELGVNDATASTPEVFLANMTTILSNIKTNHPKVSVLLIGMYDWNASAAVLAAMATIRQHLKTLADTYNCALLDIKALWGTYAEATALGLWGSESYDGNEGNDTIHPSDKGHRMIANIILDAIM